MSTVFPSASNGEARQFLQALETLRRHDPNDPEVARARSIVERFDEFVRNLDEQSIPTVREYLNAYVDRPIDAINLLSELSPLTNDDALCTLATTFGTLRRTPAHAL